jgi:hypothetical protein
MPEGRPASRLRVGGPEVQLLGMAPSPPAGYSGTPLAQKLGMTRGTRVLLRHPPVNYDDFVAPLPDGVHFEKALTAKTDLIHVFTDRRAVLEAELTRLRETMRADAAIWVSWPKKSSKVLTDITEDTIREIALPIGLVDVKVCAVSDVWSGLKLVIRKELR